MNTASLLRASEPHGGGSGPPQSGQWRGGIRSAAVSVALWLFILVASMLFSLFILAFTARMNEVDWHPISVPWQLWLSTALLLLSSALLQWSSTAARLAQLLSARCRLLAAGACAVAFLFTQWWGWLALQASHIVLAGNPAASFFYVLTAMHGLHVGGGLIALSVTTFARRDPAALAWRVALCARYWHFLLAVWLVLFAALSWLTPDVVRFICGTR